MPTPPAREQLHRRLRIVRWIALLDLVLLVALVASSASGNRQFVQALGPLHGANFLLLLAVAVTPAIDGVWGWWFPALILITAGPPGALLGEWIIVRRVRAAAANAGQSTHGGAGARHERIRQPRDTEELEQ